MILLRLLLVFTFALCSRADPEFFNYRDVKDEIYEQPINLMNSKLPHLKIEKAEEKPAEQLDWQSASPLEFAKFEAYVDTFGGQMDNVETYNRLKREPKDETRRFAVEQGGAKIRERPHHYVYPEPVKEPLFETLLPTTTKKPGVLPEQMSPGVIFRVRMSDAILRIKQRMYEDPERHIESDIIYTNLIKKVVSDEITKFHNLLLLYKTDKSIKEHLGECGGRIYKFISYMTIKVHIYCLFDALWIDGNPYVIGDEYSVTPVEVPPMLQCDASECNSVVFVDSISEPKDLDE